MLVPVTIAVIVAGTLLIVFGCLAVGVVW